MRYYIMFFETTGAILIRNYL